LKKINKNYGSDKKENLAGRKGGQEPFLMNYMNFFNKKISWWMVILISIVFGCLIMLLEILLV